MDTARLISGVNVVLIPPIKRIKKGYHTLLLEHRPPCKVKNLKTQCLGVLVGIGGVPGPPGGPVGEADDDGLADAVGDTRTAVKYAACGIVQAGIPCF